MPRFDVAVDSNGQQLVTVRCAGCGAKTQHPVVAITEGSWLECSDCGDAITVTSDDLLWIAVRAELRRRYGDTLGKRSVAEKQAARGRRRRQSLLHV